MAILFLTSKSTFVVISETISPLALEINNLNCELLVCLPITTLFEVELSEIDIRPLLLSLKDFCKSTNIVEP